MLGTCRLGRRADALQSVCRGVAHCRLVDAAQRLQAYGRGQTHGLLSERLGKNHAIRQRALQSLDLPFNTPETHTPCIAGTPEC